MFPWHSPRHFVKSFFENIARSLDVETLDYTMQFHTGGSDDHPAPLGLAGMSYRDHTHKKAASFRQKRLLDLTRAVQASSEATRAAELEIALKLAVRNGDAFSSLCFLHFGAEYSFGADNGPLSLDYLLGCVRAMNHMKNDRMFLPVEFLNDFLFCISNSFSGLRGRFSFERELPDEDPSLDVHALYDLAFNNQRRVVDFILDFVQCLPEGWKSSEIEFCNIISACEVPVGRAIMHESVSAGIPIPPEVLAYICFARIPDAYAGYNADIPQGRGVMFSREARASVLPQLAALGEQASLSVIEALKYCCEHGRGLHDVDFGLLHEVLHSIPTDNPALGEASLQAAVNFFRAARGAPEGDILMMRWKRAMTETIVNCHAAVAASAQTWIQRVQPHQSRLKAAFSELIEELCKAAGSSDESHAINAVAVIKCFIDSYIRADSSSSLNIAASIVERTLESFFKRFLNDCKARQNILGDDIDASRQPEFRYPRQSRSIFWLEPSPTSFDSASRILHIFSPPSSEIFLKAARRLVPVLVTSSHLDSNFIITVCYGLRGLIGDLETVLASNIHQLQIVFQSPPAFVRFYKDSLQTLSTLTELGSAISSISDHDIFAASQSNFESAWPNVKSLVDAPIVEDEFDRLSEIGFNHSNLKLFVPHDTSLIVKSSIDQLELIYHGKFPWRTDPDHIDQGGFQVRFQSAAEDARGDPRAEEGFGIGLTRAYFSLLAAALVADKDSTPAGPERPEKLFKEKDYLEDGGRVYWLTDRPVPLEILGLCGWAMGIALSISISTNHPCNFPLSLPVAFYSLLLKNIDQIDPDFALALLKEADPVLAKNLEKADEEGSGVVFEYTGVDGTELELVPGGSQIPVTAENKDQFMKLYAKAHFETSKLLEKMKHIREAFYAAAVTFARSRANVTPDEFKRKIEGETRIDVDDIRDATTYEEGSYPKTSDQMRWLFEYLETASQDELAKFLQFTTGTPRAPTGGFASSTKRFKFKRFEGASDNRFPTARTCFYVCYLVKSGSSRNCRRLSSVSDSTRKTSSRNSDCRISLLVWTLIAIEHRIAADLQITSQQTVNCTDQLYIPENDQAISNVECGQFRVQSVVMTTMSRLFTASR